MLESIERTDRQVAQLQERRDSLTSAMAENDDPLRGLQTQLEEQLALRLEAENELAAARQLVAEVEHLLRDAEQHRLKRVLRISSWTSLNGTTSPVRTP